MRPPAGGGPVLSNEHDNGKTCQEFYRIASNINRLKRIPKQRRPGRNEPGRIEKMKVGAVCGLEDRKMSEQRNDADDDHDDLGDLPHPRIERQALNQIENEDDDKECDQDADQGG
jgi:hypothetical protein